MNFIPMKWVYITLSLSIPTGGEEDDKANFME